MTTTKRKRLWIGGIAAAVGIALIVFAVVPLASARTGNVPSATAGGTQLTGFNQPWNANSITPTLGTGCTAGKSPSNVYSNNVGTSSVALNGWLNATPAGSTCVGETISGDAHAGWHAATFSPSSTGWFRVSATWNITAQLFLTTNCSGQGSGTYLTNYAELNVSPYFAVWNNALGDGWTLPNSVTSAYVHVDTRDQTCTSNHAVFNKTWSDHDLTVTAQAWLTSSDQYIPRAAVDSNGFVVSSSAGAGMPLFTKASWSVSATLLYMTVS
jgi:hypothetical protein